MLDGAPDGRWTCCGLAAADKRDSRGCRHARRIATAAAKGRQTNGTAAEAGRRAPGKQMRQGRTGRSDRE